MQRICLGCGRWDHGQFMYKKYLTNSLQLKAYNLHRLLEQVYMVQKSCFAVKRPPSNEQMRPEAGSGAWRRRWDSNPRGLFTLHDFQSCSLDHYETPPDGAERVGFEPTRACTLPLFESGTFDHSDISPPWSITYLAGCGKHRFF
jgi:hypothetical protein